MLNEDEKQILIDNLDGFLESCDEENLREWIKDNEIIILKKKIKKLEEKEITLIPQIHSTPIYPVYPPSTPIPPTYSGNPSTLYFEINCQ